LAIQRVAKRVAQGGHAIPPNVILRRFWNGLSNMRNLYLPLADIAAIYDNSGPKAQLIIEKGLDIPLRVLDARKWAVIEGMVP
jgi:predicted ABC-type ATPase